jgi:hypothetical protein
MSRDKHECPLCKELITINMIKGIFYQKYISQDEGVIKSKFIADSSDVEERDIQNGDIRISEEHCTIYHINFYEDWNTDLNADTFTELDWDDDFPKELNFNEKCRTLVRDDIFASFYNPERYRLPENIYVDSYVWNSKMNKETKKMFLQKFIYVYIITKFEEFAEDEGFEHFPESEEENSEEENSESEDDGGKGTKRKSKRRSARKTKRKSVRKSRKSKRKSARKSRKSKRKSRKSKRKSRKSKRKSRKSKRKSTRKSKRKSKKSARKSKRKSTRKSKRKSARKSKRKSVRKSARKSKRKSVRKSKRKSDSDYSDKCKKSSLKKYITRPGPPYPAQKCEYRVLLGNDGNIYRSSPNKNGIFSWKKI